MRLFIAVEAPEAWREAAAVQQRMLLDALPGATRELVRPVGPDLMHLTLRFLGEVDEGAVDPLQAALDGLPPFALDLGLDRAGTFGQPSRATVAWLGVRGDLDALRLLTGRIDEACALAGLPPRQDEASTPHLTLARVRRGVTAAGRRAIAEAARALEPPPAHAVEVREVALVWSRLGGASGAAPRYEVLSRHP
ncbi:MAG: RNA 2',3'-cyclic phosphodiesterase [Dehalococcoidia bacterium]